MQHSLNENFDILTPEIVWLVVVNTGVFPCTVSASIGKS